MQFDDDFGVPFSALVQPLSMPLNQPMLAPTTMFGGDIPGVQFGQVQPIQFGTITPIHVGEAKPVIEAGIAHSHTRFATVHPIVGGQIDICA